MRAIHNDVRWQLRQETCIFWLPSVPTACWPGNDYGLESFIGEVTHELQRPLHPGPPDWRKVVREEQDGNRRHLQAPTLHGDRLEVAQAKHPHRRTPSQLSQLSEVNVPARGARSLGAPCDAPEQPCPHFSAEAQACAGHGPHFSAQAPRRVRKIRGVRIRLGNALESTACSERPALAPFPDVPR